MKTYAETQNKKPFDWNEFLDRAEKGEVSPDEWNSVKNISSSWVTCACGNQCAIIPRHECGEPENGKLSDLGSMFHIYICKEDAIQAKEILRKIEIQSAKLIRIMQKPTYQR